jgi:hypothetical protein
MRRIGTISSAAGFIFLGVWMIISRNNPDLGDAIFKWWPLLIIILGVEVLVNFSLEKPEGKRARLNLLIIPVIIIFLSVNAFQGISYYFSGVNGSGFSIDKIIRWGENFDLKNYKEIDTTKTFSAYGKSFQFEADSALITFIKATDNKIKVAAKIYVNRGEDRNSYNINASEGVDGYTISMKETYIKRVIVDIYIPDGYALGVTTDSASIKTKDSFSKASYNIKTDSGNLELMGGASLALDIDSGTIKLVDIKDIKIKGDSGTINVSGNTENLDAKFDSGTFNLNNILCKNINVELNSGIIGIKTKDKNVEVNTELDSGMCTVAGERRINSGINKTLGTGEDKVRVKLDSGTIKFSSQE